MASVAYREPLSTAVGKRMIFTGPDYRKDHLPQVQQHASYIGEKRLTLERTGDLSYLWRPASHMSLPAKYKHEYVGEIGWGISEYGFINKTRLKSGFHIKYKELSQAATDEISHRYQNPWCSNKGTIVYSYTNILVCLSWIYLTRTIGFPCGLPGDIEHVYTRQPKPYIMDMLGRFSRGRIAWNMGDYENTNLRHSKGASLVRQSKAALPRASHLPKLPKPVKKEV